MAFDPTKLRPIPGMGPGFYEAGPPQPGDNIADPRNARMIALNGVGYRLDEVIRAVNCHATLVGALEQLGDAVVSGDRGKIGAALHAGNIALSKAKRIR